MSHPAMWTCPACGRPLTVALNPEGGEAGAHRPLEISRASAAAHACAPAARFPQFHNASSSSITGYEPASCQPWQPPVSAGAEDDEGVISQSEYTLTKPSSCPNHRDHVTVTKNRYVFVTNNTTWVAQTIADIYKSRWQIELFFKWIKQHLKVKRFVGRSKNAVMTQLWVAMCMYLLLAYLKFVMRLRWSLHQMLQVLQLNMFERRPLQDLFTTPSLPAPSGSQLSLAWS